MSHDILAIDAVVNIWTPEVREWAEVAPTAGYRDGARGAQHMTGHRLCRAHRKLLRVLAEHGFNSLRLTLVVELGRGTVGIDVANPRGVDPGIFECKLHSARSALAVF